MICSRKNTKNDLLSVIDVFEYCFKTGQFVNEPEVKVFDVHEGTEPEKKQATMEVKGNKLTVTRYRTQSTLVAPCTHYVGSTL